MSSTLLYRNALAAPVDLDGWVAEGPVAAAAGDDGLLLSSSGGFDDHWTLWCPEVFGDRIRISWEFSPRSEPGLAMLFFGAAAASGGGIFDDGLAHRTGAYSQYHSGDIRTLHVSYFRRRWEDERAFHTCNLRKSPGFHLVAQGADPLPPVVDARGAFYRVEVIKDGPDIAFSIDDLVLFRWTDDESTGPRVRVGRIGFRQMSPLVASYRNLEVHSL
ncbi:YesU family protein [Microbacterium lacus]|uniref:DUF1961 family protein n=1 Tax=Microbacterium lacus TaxID=415217 RepID=UPI00384DC3EB